MTFYIRINQKNLSKKIFLGPFFECITYSISNGDIIIFTRIKNAVTTIFIFTILIIIKLTFGEI